MGRGYAEVFGALGVEGLIFYETQVDRWNGRWKEKSLFELILNSFHKDWKSVRNARGDTSCSKTPRTTFQNQIITQLL